MRIDIVFTGNVVLRHIHPVSDLDQRTALGHGGQSMLVNAKRTCLCVGDEAVMVFGVIPYLVIRGHGKSISKQ